MKDGGPAFPIPVTEERLPIAINGMSLRQWYAGMALQGLLADSRHHAEALARRHGTDSKLVEIFAKFAFSFADAMIAEEEKK